MGGIVLFADCTHTLLQEVMDSFLKSFSSVFWLKQNRFSQESTKIYHCGINKVLI